MKIGILAILPAVTLLLAPLSTAFASDLPPTGVQPLSTILKSVKSQKPGRIFEAEFDHGLWEVKACKSHSCQKLYVDPQSGQVKHHKQTDRDQLPPADGMPASAVVRRVEARNKAQITEIEFEKGSWQVKLESLVDPETGKSSR